MRLLLFTNVFPNPYQPTKGVFNLRLVQALAAEHELRVISPVSWLDEWRARRRIGSRLSPERSERVEGFAIDYPRYYYPPKIGRSQYGWFLWRSVRDRILEALRTFRPEAVVGYWAHPDGEVAVRAARLAGVPAVVMVGGSDVLLLTRDPSRQRRIASVLRDADAVVTVSHDLKATLAKLGIPPEKVHVVYRGVSVERFHPGDRHEARRRLGLPADGRLLLWVGRMVPVKGLDVLIAAAALLRDRGLAFRLALVGDGPLRSSLEAEVAARGLAGLVSFVGNVGHDGLPDWYRAADLTVLPSRSEGVPNVLRESLACGTPFVASRVGGISEIAEWPELELVPPEDSAALAEGITRALTEDASEKPRPRPTSWSESAQALVRVVQSLSVPSCNGAYPTEGKGSPSRLRQRVRKLLAATVPHRLLLVNGPAASGSLCLTFDDGPHPDHTPRLLDVLKELRVTATFFVIGRNAERYPDLIRRMVAEGHLVGHHSFSHGDPAQTSAGQLLEEVRQTRDLLTQLLGAPSRWFRPPHGKVTAAKLWSLWRNGQTVVLWNADPKDFACPTAEDVRRWFRQRPPRGGDLILMHDNCPHAPEVLPELAAECRARGLTFTTIDQWI